MHARMVWIHTTGEALHKEKEHSTGLVQPSLSCTRLVTTPRDSLMLEHIQKWSSSNCSSSTIYELEKWMFCIIVHADLSSITTDSHHHYEAGASGCPDSGSPLQLILSHWTKMTTSSSLLDHIFLAVHVLLLLGCCRLLKSRPQ